MKKSWLKAWDKLEQERIQRWICRIPRHIQKVLALHGGNEHKGGRQDRDSRTINGLWKGHRIKGQLSRLDSIEGAPGLDGSDVESVDIELEDDVEDWSDVEGWRKDDEDDEEGRNGPTHRVPRPQASMIRPMEGVVQRPQERQGAVLTARIPATKVRKPLKQPVNPRTYLDHSAVWIQVYPQLAERLERSMEECTTVWQSVID